MYRVLLHCCFKIHMLQHTAVIITRIWSELVQTCLRSFRRDPGATFSKLLRKILGRFLILA